MSTPPVVWMFNGQQYDSEIKMLVAKIHKLDEERGQMIARLIELVNPTPDEIESVYGMYREDSKEAAEICTEFFLPLDVLDDREAAAEDENTEAHNG